jgi:hypothetical protein
MKNTVVEIRSAPIEIGPGAELGSWRLVEVLGEGAMGKVWRGEHTKLGRAAAIKVLNAEYCARPDVVQRFFREARVVNDIDHENIVEVTDFVEVPGLAYLVMELLEGASLRELMKAKGRKRLPLGRALAILAQVCDALEAAHQKGVVHRDLKPDNVFVVNRRGADFAKVLDFGVAKLRDVEEGVVATHTGVVLGTPLYMSPEQAVGRGVDRATDIWAAGVVLYELLAGKVPFTADTFVDLVQRIREAPPDPLPARTPRGERIPPELAAAVMRCLEKKPADRFRSMAALAEALRGNGRVRARLRWGRLARPAAVAAIAVAVGWAVLAFDVPGRVASAIGSGWRSVRSVASKVPADLPERIEAALPRAVGPTSNPTPTPARSERGAESTETPATGKATRAPAAKPIARPEPARVAPRQVATVELHVRSTPAGASLVRLDTGERLGKTPARVRVPRKAATVWLRLALDGWQPVKFAVDLRKDGAANVTLHRVRRAGHHR